MTAGPQLRFLDGETCVIGLLGYPVRQVRSPRPLTELMQANGFNAVQLPLHVAPDDLAQVVTACKAIRNLAGLVLTVPHKVAALDLVDRATGTAQTAGSINVMRREPDGSWLGDNLDGQAFVAGLAAQGYSVAGKSAFIAGAGGAGSSVAASFAQAGAREIRLFDLQADRASAVAARIARFFPDTAVVVQEAIDPDGCDIAINATYLGLRPEDPLPFDPSGLAKSTLVAELVMNPPVTRLLDIAERTGHPTAPSENVLNYQLPRAAEFFAQANVS
ncbi:shikimate dehydrogenase family protein [Pseudochelatococcus sp. B33]